ncbi:HD-GYP domain-containing protein [Stratiformator vulcanicus]|uniref:Cyclic di-GMP phosphodiesterase response regulator RpfG n=1 Tax=Stratiformator vulcanicus TaxID=2527980 RepID=A0A517QY43_9PLAN|nr:HD domain-containing phosphohydrolase [Stratiformator vulcanicus]QDT36523.1 Cyclic di-GMP phosphodiesterase response regulator RpfG [Stratiformator vulcanicus]
MSFESPAGLLAPKQAESHVGPTDHSILILTRDDSVGRLAAGYLHHDGYANVTVDAIEAAAGAGEHPGEDGDFDLLIVEAIGDALPEALRDFVTAADRPYLILSRNPSPEARVDALRAGASDVATIPIDPTELLTLTRRTLLQDAERRRWRLKADELEQTVLTRTTELEASRLEVIHCLARASEFRDVDTGNHVTRVGRYSDILADELECDAEIRELIGLAAPLHDIGKIGIPDSILLKPGRLNEEERSRMQAHAAIGEEIARSMSDEVCERYAKFVEIPADVLKSTRSPVLVMAARIAATHHEWWDGKGYPRGLAGEEIPIEGRIVAVADVFDALCSKRPYKPAFPMSKAIEILQEGRGTQFDPAVIDAFISRLDDIIAIRYEWVDE